MNQQELVKFMVVLIVHRLAYINSRDGKTTIIIINYSSETL